jgi:hypothetical protein
MFLFNTQGGFFLFGLSFCSDYQSGLDRAVIDYQTWSQRYVVPKIQPIRVTPLFSRSESGWP